jgi:hypothetical protein
VHRWRAESSSVATLTRAKLRGPPGLAGWGCSQARGLFQRWVRRAAVAAPWGRCPVQRRQGLRLHRCRWWPGRVRPFQRDRRRRLPQPGGRAEGQIRHYPGPEGALGGERQGHRLTHRPGPPPRHWAVPPSRHVDAASGPSRPRGVLAAIALQTGRGSPRPPGGTVHWRRGLPRPPGRGRGGQTATCPQRPS